MNVRVQHSESAGTAQQSTVTKEPQLCSSHTQHLSFRISVTATFPIRQIILLNALSRREYFPGHGGLLLMNGLPAHAFHSQAAKACVWRDNPRHLSRRGWKILLHFSHLSLVHAHKSALCKQVLVRSHTRRSSRSTESVWSLGAVICELHLGQNAWSHFV